MPQFLVSVFNDPRTRLRPPEEMAPIHAAVSAVNEEAIAAGIFVFAGGLEDRSSATVVDPRSGSPVLSDGPYVEAEEYVGGFWIIEVPDLDVALEWARRFAVACTEVLEVRPFMALPD